WADSKEEFLLTMRRLVARFSIAIFSNVLRDIEEADEPSSGLTSFSGGAREIFSRSFLHRPHDASPAFRDKYFLVFASDLPYFRDEVRNLPVVERRVTHLSALGLAKAKRNNPDLTFGGIAVPAPGSKYGFKIISDISLRQILQHLNGIGPVLADIVVARLQRLKTRSQPLDIENFRVHGKIGDRRLEIIEPFIEEISSGNLKTKLTSRSGGQKTIAIFHYRIGKTDGVSLEVAKRKKMLEEMGHRVILVAGPRQVGADYVIDELEFANEPISSITRNAIEELSGFSPGELEREIFNIADRIQPQIRRILERENIEVMYIHNMLSMPLNLGASIALVREIERTGIPAVGLHHDFYWEGDIETNPTCTRVEELIEEYLVPNLDNVLHITINTLNHDKLLRERGIKAQVNYDVFDFDQPAWVVDDFNSDFRGRFGIKDNDLVVLQATRIVPNKAIECAIDFVRRLEEERSKLEGRRLYSGQIFSEESSIVLVLAGYAEDSRLWYEQELARIAEEAGINIVFAGDWIERKRGYREGEKIYSLWDAYTACDIVTYPSIWEGWGNQFIEAVFGGKIIVMVEYLVYQQDIAKEGYKVISLGSDFELYKKGEHYFCKLPEAAVERAVNEAIEILLDRKLYHRIVKTNRYLGRIHHSYQVLRRYLEASLRWAESLQAEILDTNEVSLVSKSGGHSDKLSEDSLVASPADESPGLSLSNHRFYSSLVSVLKTAVPVLAILASFVFPARAFAFDGGPIGEGEFLGEAGPIFILIALIVASGLIIGIIKAAISSGKNVFVAFFEILFAKILFGKSGMFVIIGKILLAPFKAINLIRTWKMGCGLGIGLAAVAAAFAFLYVGATDIEFQEHTVVMAVFAGSALLIALAFAGIGIKGLGKGTTPVEHGVDITKKIFKLLGIGLPGLIILALILAATGNYGETIFGYSWYGIDFNFMEFLEGMGVWIIIGLTLAGVGIFGFLKKGIKFTGMFGRFFIIVVSFFIMGGCGLLYVYSQGAQPVDPGSAYLGNRISGIGKFSLHWTIIGIITAIISMIGLFSLVANKSKASGGKLLLVLLGIPTAVGLGVLLITSWLNVLPIIVCGAALLLTIGLRRLKQGSFSFKTFLILGGIVTIGILWFISPSFPDLSETVNEWMGYVTPSPTPIPPTATPTPLPTATPQPTATAIATAVSNAAATSTSSSEVFSNVNPLLPICAPFVPGLVVLAIILISRRVRSLTPISQLIAAGVYKVKMKDDISRHFMYMFRNTWDVATEELIRQKGIRGPPCVLRFLALFLPVARSINSEIEWNISSLLRDSLPQEVVDSVEKHEEAHNKRLGEAGAIRSQAEKCKKLGNRNSLTASSGGHDYHLMPLSHGPEPLSEPVVVPSLDEVFGRLTSFYEIEARIGLHQLRTHDFGVWFRRILRKNMIDLSFPAKVKEGESIELTVEVDVSDCGIRFPEVRSSLVKLLSDRIEGVVSHTKDSKRTQWTYLLPEKTEVNEDTIIYTFNIPTLSIKRANQAVEFVFGVTRKGRIYTGASSQMYGDGEWLWANGGIGDNHVVYLSRMSFEEFIEQVQELIGIDIFNRQDLTEALNKFYYRQVVDGRILDGFVNLLRRIRSDYYFNGDEIYREKVITAIFILTDSQTPRFLIKLMQGFLAGVQRSSALSYLNRKVADSRQEKYADSQGSGVPVRLSSTPKEAGYFTSSAGGHVTAENLKSTLREVRIEHHLLCFLESRLNQSDNREKSESLIAVLLNIFISEGLSIYSFNSVMASFLSSENMEETCKGSIELMSAFVATGIDVDSAVSLLEMALKGKDFVKAYPSVIELIDNWRREGIGTDNLAYVLRCVLSCGNVELSALQVKNSLTEVRIFFSVFADKEMEDDLLQLLFSLAMDSNNMIKMLQKLTEAVDDIRFVVGAFEETLNKYFLFRILSGALKQESRISKLISLREAHSEVAEAAASLSGQRIRIIGSALEGLVWSQDIRANSIALSTVSEDLKDLIELLAVIDFSEERIERMVMRITASSDVKGAVYALRSFIVTSEDCELDNTYIEPLVAGLIRNVDVVFAASQLESEIEALKNLLNLFDRAGIDKQQQTNIVAVLAAQDDVGRAIELLSAEARNLITFPEESRGLEDDLRERKDGDLFAKQIVMVDTGPTRGSAFVVGTIKGYYVLLTNTHVVRNTDEVLLRVSKSPSESLGKARVLLRAKDKESFTRDIAVLLIEKNESTAASLESLKFRLGFKQRIPGGLCSGKNDNIATGKIVALDRNLILLGGSVVEGDSGSPIMVRNPAGTHTYSAVGILAFMGGAGILLNDLVFQEMVDSLEDIYAPFEILIAEEETLESARDFFESIYQRHVLALPSEVSSPREPALISKSGGHTENNLFRAYTRFFQGKYNPEQLLFSYAFIPAINSLQVSDLSLEANMKPFVERLMFALTATVVLFGIEYIIKSLSGLMTAYSFSQAKDRRVSMRDEELARIIEDRQKREMVLDLINFVIKPILSGAGMMSAISSIIPAFSPYFLEGALGFALLFSAVELLIHPTTIKKVMDWVSIFFAFYFWIYGLFTEPACSSFLLPGILSIRLQTILANSKVVRGPPSENTIKEETSQLTSKSGGCPEEGVALVVSFPDIESYQDYEYLSRTFAVAERHSSQFYTPLRQAMQELRDVYKENQWNVAYDEYTPKPSAVAVAESRLTGLSKDESFDETSLYEGSLYLLWFEDIMPHIRKISRKYGNLYGEEFVVDLLFRLTLTVFEEFPYYVEYYLKDLEAPKHGFGHTLQVVDFALSFLAEQKEREGLGEDNLRKAIEIILPAALLHDLAHADRAKIKTHHKYGAIWVGMILENHPERFSEYNRHDIKAIQHAVHAHRSSKEPSPGNFESFSREGVDSDDFVDEELYRLYELAA
ncbi:MAG: glycosyltransferase, partial [Candidatus Omnitrophica bacterium]|nr:glycosyltransferase [Candidatus Omnitrophota bacterium]MBD3268829.1 glycosyltransferase [Candidatus Omnitrophota bacterium]